MVFKKGDKQPDTTPRYTAVTRKIIDVWCEDCTYRRRVDFAFYPTVRTDTVRESARAHMYDHGHTINIQTTVIQRMTPK